MHGTKLYYIEAIIKMVHETNVPLLNAMKILTV